MAAAFTACITFDAAPPPGQRWTHTETNFVNAVKEGIVGVCNASAVVDWPLVRSGRVCMLSMGYRLEEEN
jgi:hypothetical protein